jgi:hypothetical protein
MADRDEDRESEKGFRVVDRRRFTSEGELRADAPPDQPPTPSSPLTEPSRPEPRREEPKAPAGPGQRAAQPAGDPRRAAPPPEAPPEPEPGIDFLSFAASLATNALAALGLLPPEQTRGMPRDPTLAREYIDILVMLQRKTRGNLDAREERALAQMVGDLQLQYVEATRSRR